VAQIIRHHQVETQNGEVKLSITLDLNINLTNNSISIEPRVAAPTPPAAKDEDDKKWAIPDFSSPGRLKFGKTEVAEQE
jgi:hypothetical protein